MRVESVIFDMDNTLYDEMQYVRSGFKTVSEYMAERFKIDKERFFQLLMSILAKDGRGRVFDTALEEYGIKNEKTVLEMINIYRNHSPSIEVSKETKYILRRLRRMHRLGLITDGFKKVQEIKAKKLNMMSFFDVITYASEYGGKNRKVFLTTLKKLGAKPSSSIYVDDNPTKAFSVAKKLGIHTIRLMKGENKNIIVAAEECKSDFEISELEEIQEIICHIENI